MKKTRISLDNILHPRIINNCLRLHLECHFKHAAREAMTQVELALKERTGMNKLYGRNLTSAIFGNKKCCIKLRVPFGDELQEDANKLFDAAFGYYRNYAIHDGSLINEQISFRIMVIATELLELIGASNKSFEEIGGVDGLLKHGIFTNSEHLRDILNFLNNYTFPEEANDGYFEDLFSRGFSEDQVNAVIEVGLVEYENFLVDVPKEFQDFIGDSKEELGTFKLTSVGAELLQKFNKQIKINQRE